MKRISLFFAAALLSAPVFLHAQDAATEERINQLNGKIDALIEAKNAQNKRIDELAKQLREVQEQLNKPNANYAAQDDVKALAVKLQEIDQKRQSDNERILKEFESLGRSLASTPKKNSAPPSANPPPSAAGSNKVYEYVVKPGDTVDAIARAYREQNIKVTADQILAENPKLRPESMRIGEKIFIPVPQ